MNNPLKLLNNAIESKPIDIKQKIRFFAYITLALITTLLWFFGKNTQLVNNILFIGILALLFESLYFSSKDIKIELEETKDEIINKMAELIEFKDSDTGYHVKRVSEYTRLLATLEGSLSSKEIELLAQASPLHDIGKIAIKDVILTKDGKLTDSEYDEMKTHAEKGYDIFKDSKKDYLKLAAKIANEHHEKWDGSGYPRKLKEEEISIEGRITAIADVFDALAHDRVYKDAWPMEKIFNLFEKEKGKHFDPNLMKLFLDNREQFIQIKEKYNKDYPL